jgi:hypothetical protein
MASLMKELSDIVPQFYYDLIARVASGAIAAIVLAAAYGHYFPWLDQLGAAGLAATALVASYLFGLILDLSSEFLLSGIGRGIVRILKKLPTREKKRSTRNWQWPTDSELWNTLGDFEQKDSSWVQSQVPVLRKMMAERTLLRVAFLELALFVPTFYAWPPTEFTDTWTTAFVIAAFLLLVLVAFISLDICLKERIKAVRKVAGRVTAGAGTGDREEPLSAAHPTEPIAPQAPQTTPHPE